MSVSGMSNLSALYNSQALNSVAQAVKTGRDAESSFIVTEAPPEAAAEGTGGQDWRSPEMMRQLVKMGRPPMVSTITGTGCWSQSTAEDRGKLDSLVDTYFEEVKEEFGCHDGYMPYAPGLPEFDPVIEENMKRALYAKVEADPEAERLVKAVGGVWPPPDRLNLASMTYGPGAQPYGSGPWTRAAGT